MPADRTAATPDVAAVSTDRSGGPRGAADRSADRERLLADTRRQMDRGQLAEALNSCRTLVERHPDDWAAVNLLGDLYARAGDAAAAAGQLRRVADHFRNEGFLAKAAALYRRILKLHFDERVLGVLADVAIEQGLLADARAHLTELERRRREAGDIAGAGQCLERMARLGAGDRAAGAPVTRDAPISEPTPAAPAPPPEAEAAGGPEASRRAGDGAIDAPDTPPPVPTLESVFERMRQVAEDEIEAAAVTAAPDDPDETAARLFELASGLERLSEVERALAIYRKLEAHAPGYRDVRARIARLSGQQGSGE